MLFKEYFNMDLAFDINSKVKAAAGGTQFSPVSGPGPEFKFVVDRRAAKSIIDTLLRYGYNVAEKKDPASLKRMGDLLGTELVVSKNAALNVSATAYNIHGSKNQIPF